MSLSAFCVSPGNTMTVSYMTGLMVGSVVAYAAYSFTAPPPWPSRPCVTYHTPVNTTAFWMSTHLIKQTHINTQTCTHTCSHLHMRDPGQKKQHWLMDSSPAAEDKKSSVMNPLKVHVYTQRDWFSFVQIMLQFGSLDKGRGIRSKKNRKLCQTIKMQQISPLSNSPVTFKCHGSAVMNFSLEVKNGSCASVREPTEVHWVSHSDIIVCTCVQTDWLAFVQCKVKWVFTAGNQRLAVFGEILCHGSHMWHFTIFSIQSRDKVSGWAFLDQLLWIFPHYDLWKPLTTPFKNNNQSNLKGPHWIHSETEAPDMTYL